MVYVFIWIEATPQIVASVKEIVSALEYNSNHTYVQAQFSGCGHDSSKCVFIQDKPVAEDSLGLISSMAIYLNFLKCIVLINKLYAGHFHGLHCHEVITIWNTCKLEQPPNNN